MADPFEELYETYKKMIYSYLYQLTLNAHTAEELTHDTFLKAFKAFGKFRGESSIKTWLYTIARNTYLSENQKKSRQLEQQTDLLEIDFEDQSNNISKSNDRLFLQAVLKQLQDRERNLILLRDFHGFTYQEMVGLLHINEGQIRVGLHRARKKLKAIVASESEEG